MSKRESTGARAERRKREAARFALTTEQRDAAIQTIDIEELRPFLVSIGGLDYVLRTEVSRFRGEWLRGDYGEDRDIGDCWSDFTPDPERYCPPRERVYSEIDRKGRATNWVTRR